MLFISRLNELDAGLTMRVAGFMEARLKRRAPKLWPRIKPCLRIITENQAINIVSALMYTVVRYKGLLSTAINLSPAGQHRVWHFQHDQLATLIAADTLDSLLKAFDDLKIDLGRKGDH